MNKKKNMPLYLKLANNLKNEILDMQHKIGDLLPTEEELQQQFKASRTTVRRAVEVLENEGFVKRHQGRGTRICSVNPRQNLNYVSSITETLKEIYGNVITGAFSIIKTHPSKEIQESFNISEKQEVYKVHRTKVVQGKVIAYLKNIVFARYVPDLEKHSDSIKSQGLYQTFEQVYGLELDYAIENISVYMSGPLESEIFELQYPIPLYCSQRTTYLSDGSLFEIDKSFIRAEDFEYTVYLKGRNQKNF